MQDLAHLEGLPSKNPVLFSRLDKDKRDNNSNGRAAPKLYVAAHGRTQPPADQVIGTETTSVLVREFERVHLAKSPPSNKRTAQPADERQNKVARRQRADGTT